MMLPGATIHRVVHRHDGYGESRLQVYLQQRPVSALSPSNTMPTAAVTNTLCRQRLYRTTVISPLEQGLPLSGPAKPVPWFAIRTKLRDVTAEGSPPSDLSSVFVRYAATKIVAAIPLKPATRVVRIDPSFVLPF